MAEKVVQEYQDLTPKQLEEIKDIIAKTQVLKVTEDLGVDNLEGTSAYHYKFTVDKNRIKEEIIKVNTIRGKTISEQELADLDARLATVGVTDGEIWIGKKDRLPYKVVLSIATEKIDIPEVSTDSTITLSFSNYNKPVQIETPESFKTIEEVMAQMSASGLSDTESIILEKWNNAGISCAEHQNLATHMHLQLLITVDGKEETIDGDIGILPNCMAEIHVHRNNAPNILHVESEIPNRKLTLGQFFVVYDKPIKRDGYVLEMRVNGDASNEYENLILADGQVIELIYKR